MISTETMVSSESNSRKKSSSASSCKRRFTKTLDHTKRKSSSDSNLNPNSTVCTRFIETCKPNMSEDLKISIDWNSVKRQSRKSMTWWRLKSCSCDLTESSMSLRFHTKTNASNRSRSRTNKKWGLTPWSSKNCCGLRRLSKRKIC